MSTVVRLAVTKWLEDGELCEAIFTERNDLAEFAKDWQMLLEKDKDSLTDEQKQWPAAPHEVPIGIFAVVLNQNEKEDFGPTFDALMDLGRAMDCCHFDDLMRLLFFEGFKAGMKYQAQQPQPVATP